MFGVANLVRVAPLTALLSGVAWLWEQSPFAIIHDVDEPPRFGQVIDADFTSFMKQLLQSQNIQGISLSIVHATEGEQSWTEYGAWGRKTEGANDDLTPDTVFATGSLSKAFVASSIGILIDDFGAGRNVTVLPDGVQIFDWDTKVADLLPNEWKLMDEWATQKASVRDILAHVSGLTRHDFVYKSGDSLSDILGYLPQLRPAFELREQWSYNNIMYIVASRIVTKYSAMSYMDFVSTRIFRPLNMSASTFWPSEVASSLSQGWSGSGRRLPFWASDEMVELMAGPGGVLSNAVDMAKWVDSLLNRGIDRVSNSTILSAEAWSATTSPLHIIPPGFAPMDTILGYGMGWIKLTFGGHNLVFHGGNVPGFSSLLFFCPTEGVGAAILSNGDSVEGPLLAIISRILAGLPGFTVSDASPSSAADQSYEDHESLRSISDKKAGFEAALTLPLHAYEGTYSNAVYGDIILCASHDGFSQGNWSSVCESVLSDFAPFEHLNGSKIDSGTRLYASWPHVWSTHLRFIHETGDNFAMYTTTLYPDGYGSDRSPWETAQPGPSDKRAMFALEENNGQVQVKGFGMTFQPEVIEYRKRHGLTSPEELVEVWFTRI